ncbi:exodeoxyribonuclease V subunit alpha [Rhodanobacter sp. C03]|uniref:exodeoxyribonuclease V subunit alpha n=1 Tax=Rhodanobacter sp. C03 TaxID=1945858 RepID=UPI00098558FD|nr:exodeoxyribonuclease V subunit alpha [Rhodanobacter sp. C03]OOG57262.1 exodeoxyribonuclease V subunit alpha [Rhodanobacter sp. C03]
MSHDAVFELLDQAVATQRLRPLDIALARFLAERDGDTAPGLLWLAALLSRQLADGHLCLDLEALPALADEQDWPSGWRPLLRAITENPAALSSSPLVADGHSGHPAAAPLVLDGTRLYLRRYWNHERQVAAAIRVRLTLPQAVPEQLADELTRLFPTPCRSDFSRDAPGVSQTESIAAEAAPTNSTPDWPKIACALAACGAFTVITGGPGTGKTTTVVRLLGLLQTLQLRQHARPLRIRLAAPTGKAAARLNASIAAQIAQLDVDDATRAAIPAEVVTLHRLLGARPDTRRFRHDRGNPLHLDLLVVDEASMIDLEMMSAVLAALPPTARLILLGDKDQLSSVEAGAVLGDLCRRAETGHYSASTADWLCETTGSDIRAFVCADAQPLDQQLAMLRHSHRFGDSSGIGQLARAVNAGDTDRVHALLATPSTDLAWLPVSQRMQLAELAIDGGNVHLSVNDGSTIHHERAVGYRHYLELLRRERPASAIDAAAHDHWARDVLQAFNRFQLLCALRQGPHGVEGLNQLIADALHAQGLIESSHGWYEGRPIMLTRNDYSLGLANGDVGICLRLPDERGHLCLSVAFLASATAGSTSSTRIRHVVPARLGEVATVYAMTVHKSQGSEFEHTALVLPTEASNVLTRELLYTGITRARRWFSLLGSEAIVDLATRQRTRRYSGLAERLSSN